MKKFILLMLVSSIIIVPRAHSGAMSISASVDKNTAALDEQILLELNISGDVSNLPNPVIPDMSNFTVYSSGRSQSLSIVNGQMSSSLIFRYTLVPKNVGKYTLRPITMQYDGKTYQTESIQVEILPAGKAPAARQNTASGGGVASPEKTRDLFITASIDKASAYVNEQLTYTFKFYRKIRLLANPQYTPADFTGFWTEDTPPVNYYSNVDGVQYLVTEVKTLIFPAKPGRYNLGSASLRCSVEDFSQNDPSSDSFFSSFFSGGKTQVLNTNPVSLSVLSLPEKGRPAGFSGAVGKYSVTASADKKSVRANEPVTLTVTISGTGNIKTVPDPALPDWPDFRKYETAGTLNLNKDGGALKGSKEYKTIIVPLTAGRKTIKPVSFVYFDPAAGSYKTAETESINLEVLPAARGSASVLSPISKGNGVSVLSSDIRYIKMPRTWAQASGPLYKKPWFLAVNSLPLLLLMLYSAYAGWRRKLSGDEAFARRLRAASTAKKYLKKAKYFLKAKAPACDYYNAISRALLEYVADKMNVSADGLTAATLSTMLSERQVSRETIEKVSKILEECDLVRFAPAGSGPGTAEDAFRSAEDLIGRLEKELKKR